MSPLSCHPSVFAPHGSRLECAPTEPSLALLCMFLAETRRSLRAVFLKKTLRNIVSSNLSIHFHCHLQTCFCCWEDKSGMEKCGGWSGTEGPFCVLDRRCFFLSSPGSASAAVSNSRYSLNPDGPRGGLSALTVVHRPARAPRCGRCLLCQENRE